MRRHGEPLGGLLCVGAIAATVTMAVSSGAGERSVGGSLGLPALPWPLGETQARNRALRAGVAGVAVISGCGISC